MSKKIYNIFLNILFTIFEIIFYSHFYLGQQKKSHKNEKKMHI